MAEMQKLKVEVVRYNPEVDTAPHSAFYEVPYDEQTSLLDALGYIKDNLAPDLSYRWSCRRRETLRERHFVEHHREVGSKIRHDSPSGQISSLKVVFKSSICAASRQLVGRLPTSRKILAVSSSSSLA